MWWSILAGLIVVGNEALFFRAEHWSDRAWAFIPMALAANYALFRVLRSSPTLLDGFLVFSVCTVTLRVCVSRFVLQQRVSHGTWAGVALVVAARCLQLVWR